MNNYLNLDIPKYQSSYIKVIGVGGCGTNTANYLYQSNSSQVDFIVCNTDATHLSSSPVPVKIQLGSSGLGAGTDPEVARTAAEQQKDEIKKAIGNDARMIFITAGFGKGTGTGASPIIAQIARDIEKEINEEVLIVAIVTFPPEYEGEESNENAKNGIAKLREVVDATIVIDNNKISNYEDMDVEEAHAMVDSILVTAVKCISDMMTANAKVRVDFNDVKKVLKRSGIALMGVGEAEGEGRAEKAIYIATSSELLDDQNYTDATNVLVSISSSPEAKIKISEINIIMNYIRNTMTNKKVKIISSQDTNDASLEGRIKVAIVVSGFSTAGVVIHEQLPEYPFIPVPEPVFPDGEKITTPESKIEMNEDASKYFEKEQELIVVEIQQPTETETVIRNDFVEEKEEWFYSVGDYNLSSMEDKIKAEQTLVHQQRIEAITQLWKTDEGLHQYTNMSSQDLHEMLGLQSNIAKEDGSVLISNQQTLTNINEKGEIDLNLPAFLHSRPC